MWFDKKRTTKYVEEPWLFSVCLLSTHPSDFTSQVCFISNTREKDYISFNSGCILEASRELWKILLLGHTIQAKSDSLEVRPGYRHFIKSSSGLEPLDKRFPWAFPTLWFPYSYTYSLGLLLLPNLYRQWRRKASLIWLINMSCAVMIWRFNHTRLRKISTVERRVCVPNLLRLS